MNIKKKIAVIDDQEDVRKIVQAILLKEGYEVITGTNGGLIDKSLSANYPDLIILDINLDDADGRDICINLKARIETRNIPIILMSAIVDLQNISTACGAEDYLSKPFPLTELVNKVQKYLQAA